MTAFFASSLQAMPNTGKHVVEAQALNQLQATENTKMIWPGFELVSAGGEEVV